MNCPWCGLTLWGANIDVIQAHMRRNRHPNRLINVVRYKKNPKLVQKMSKTSEKIILQEKTISENLDDDPSQAASRRLRSQLFRSINSKPTGQRQKDPAWDSHVGERVSTGPGEIRSESQGLQNVGIQHAVPLLLIRPFQVFLIVKCWQNPLIRAQHHKMVRNPARSSSNRTERSKHRPM